MHSAVPNVSARLVFQSQPSLLPDASLDLSNPTSSDRSSSCETSKSSFSTRSSSSGSDSPHTQERFTEAQEALQMLSIPAAVLGHSVPGYADQAALTEPSTDGTSSALPVEQSVEPTSQVQAAVQRFEQLNEQQAASSPMKQTSAGSAKPTRDWTGIMRLAPLLIPILSDPEQDQTVANTPTGIATAASDSAGTSAGTIAPRSKPRHQPALQGATARNQAAIAAHQARLAALHQKGHPRQPHGFGSSAAGHADAAVAGHDGDPEPADKTLKSPVGVQRSSASASR